MKKIYTGIFILLINCSYSQNRYSINEITDPFGEIVYLKSNNKKLTGIVCWYDNNCNLSMFIPYENGIRDGIQRNWDDNGLISYEAIWEKGILKNQKCFMDGINWPCED